MLEKTNGQVDSVSELHSTPGTPFNVKTKIEYHF